MNPFEYRDLMNVAYGYSTDTVDQVTARYAPKGSGAKKKSLEAGEPLTAQASGEEMAKFQALLARAEDNSQDQAVQAESE